jgi:hypothetical protein
MKLRTVAAREVVALADVVAVVRQRLDGLATAVWPGV